MKILIQQSDEPTMVGIAQVLTQMLEPHEVIIWDSNTPINDSLDKYNPDVVIGYEDNITKWPGVKTFLISNLFKGMSSGYCDFTEEQFDNNNANKISLSPAANFTFHNIQPSKRYASDVFYYSQNTSMETLPYLLEVEKHHQLKIVGPHRLPLASYLGQVTADETIRMMKSCRVALAFDPSTLYTYAANKVFCITDQSNGFFPVFSTPDMLLEHIDASLNDTLVQKSELVSKKSAWSSKMAIDEAYSTIVANIDSCLSSRYCSISHQKPFDTYFHRVHEIFTELKCDDLAQKCLDQLQKIISQTENK